MKNWLLTLLLVSGPAYGQSVEVSDPPAGKEKAQEYFKARQSNESAAPARSIEGPTPRYLAVHIGTFFSSEAYKWSRSSQDDVGKLNAGVTYRIGEWVNSMDLNFRFDYTDYDLREGAARKLSFGGLLTFPDANSRFPLYFGGGLGAGIFMKQINDESALALDWTLLGGARFLNVFENVGFLVEAGMKNHIFLLSDGQFNGVFINVGSVFAF